jgi:hypothetical protein
MHGPLDANAFFIDVVEPEGQYMVMERAGAPATARHWNAQIKARGESTLADIPADVSEPLARPVLKKALKYSASRGNSSLLGVVAYFHDATHDGKRLLAMLAYLKGMRDAFGNFPEEVAGLLLTPGPSMNMGLIVTDVTWDHPIAFLMQLIDGPKPRAALLVNVHPRIDTHRHNEVVQWMTSLLMKTG